MLEPNLGQEPRDRCTPKLVELGKIAHTGIPEWMGWLPSTNFKWVIVELQCVRWPLDAIFSMAFCQETPTN